MGFEMGDSLGSGSPLTPRELEVLQLVARGLTNAEIAAELGITFNTTRNHVATILDKRGVGSREAAARWLRTSGPKELRQSGPRRRTLRALAPLGAIGWPLKQVGAVAAVVLLGGVGVAMLVAVNTGLRTERATGGEPVVQPELHSAHVGDGFEVFLAEDYVLPEAAILVTQFNGPFENGSGPWVGIMDPATGDIVARVATSCQPMPVFRRSTGELLISDAPGPASGPLSPRLLVFDARDGLRLTQTIAMPEHSNFTIYGRGVALSVDERYVFYRARDSSIERPLDGCVSNSPSCDRILTGVIDLDATAPEARLVHIVAGACGIPRAFGGALAAIVCENPGGQFLLDGASGTVSDPSSLNAQVEALRGGEGAGGLVAFALHPDLGTPGGLFSTGEYRWLDGQSRPMSARALPPGTRPAGPELVRFLDNGRIVAAYTRSGSATVGDGISIFNLASGEIERVIPLEGIVSLAAAGSSIAIAGLEDGSIVQVDLAAQTHQPVPGLQLELGHRWSISSFELAEPRGTPVPDSSNPDELFHLPIYVVPG